MSVIAMSLARSLLQSGRPMMKLTRFDHRTVAINPDHVAFIEAVPDTTLCLLGDRRILVRESLDEVIDLFIQAQRAMGRGHLGAFAEVIRHASQHPRAGDE